MRIMMLTFFAFLGDSLGRFAAAVAFLQRQTAGALVGGRVTFGPGSLGVAASWNDRSGSNQ